MKKLFLLSCIMGLALSLVTSCQDKKQNNEPVEPQQEDVYTPSVVFNADSAMASIVTQCSFGPRIPESEAHRRCGDYLVKQFRAYGLEVKEQTTTVKGWDDKNLPCRNIIASYAPEAEERIIVCAHWDCRPWADNDADKNNHRKPVMGANDGASGVAVMVELARLMKEIQPKVGVDFICFDMEDYGAPYWGQDKAPQDGSDWCLGSQYWAKHPHVSNYKAKYGILLDMVGGRNATFYFEGFSVRYAPTVVQNIWATAQMVGAGRYFLAEDGSWATDDHVPLNEIAGIPTADVVPYQKGEQSSFGKTWHTVNDTPENISKETLQAVGQTMVEVLLKEK